MPRKRGHGEYVDEETGEVREFMTLKEAKKRHKKQGKWYKEATEEELRLWDKEEKRQESEKARIEREKKRKINKKKQDEKSAKEREAQRQQLAEGKITMSQTWGKRPASQPHLHKFFGKPVVNRVESEEDSTTDFTESEAESNSINVARHVQMKKSEDHNSHDSSSEDSSDCLADNEDEPEGAGEEANYANQSEQRISQRLSQVTLSGVNKCNEDENVHAPERAVDNSTGLSGIQTSASGTVSRIQASKDDVIFKVPALPTMNPPRCAPLSVTNRSDSVQIQEKADTQIPSMTQIVRETVSFLSTQDLEDDALSDDKGSPGVNMIDDNVSKDDFLDEELDDAALIALAATQKHTSSPTRKMSPEPILSTMNNNADNTFNDVFDDGGLSDTDFLAFTSPKLRNPISTILKSGEVVKLPKGITLQLVNAREPARDLQRVDSFGMDGLTDEDLLEGLDKFESGHENDVKPTGDTPSPPSPKFVMRASRAETSPLSPEWDPWSE